MELREIFEKQKEFDRRLGWNIYEKCQTPEETLKFMEHFVLVMVEELGEIARVRKQYHRDKQAFVVEHLRHEMADVFVYLMQGCMALSMDLELEYLNKLKDNEERFLNKARDH